MPVLAFGFGSFGDILAAVQLAVRITIILRQSGNSTECAETEKELKALSGDLDLADRTLQQMAGSPLAPFVAERIRDEVVQCHKLMARFFMKITAPQSLVQNIRWAASQEKELAKLRTQINERRSVLGLVMHVINSVGCRGALMAVHDRIDDVAGQTCTMVSATLLSSLTTSAGKYTMGTPLIQDVHNGVSNVSQQLDEVGGQVRHGHALIQDVHNGVSNISQQLDEVGGQVRHGHTLIQDVHNSISKVSQHLNEVGDQVRHGHNLIQDGFSGLVEQFTTHHAQIMAVINHVPNGVSEAMFVVVSPTGISIPVSVTFCTSYSVLDGLLKTYLGGQKKAGGHYVERGDYSIVSPEGDTIRPSVFIRTLKVGLCLEMSIIWRESRWKIQAYHRLCPQCKGRRVKTSRLTGWMTCQNPSCGSRYRTRTLWNTIIHRRPARRPVPVSDPQSPPTSAMDPTEDEDEDETTCFRRIEVVAPAPARNDWFRRIYTKIIGL
ncbi:hypothetical protein DFH09DRAFT_1091260 [Mycena vulgaris]|nr:hypothetical protein DFH09DRAFT_1091260 [Mycena vulgaris]